MESENAHIKKHSPPYLIPASIIVAGLIIAFAVVYSGGTKEGGSAKNPSPAPSGQVAAVGEAAKLLEIGEEDFILGNPSAPVVFVEFGDFQCPFCGRFFNQTLPQIKEKYVKTGQVAFVWRDFAFLGQESFDAAQAARCAGEQDKFWDYHDYLFNNQNGENRGAFSVSNLKGFARKLNLNGAAFDECLDSRKYLSVVENESRLARELGVSGTPSSFINGRNITGALSFAQFEAVILDALK